MGHAHGHLLETTSCCSDTTDTTLELTSRALLFLYYRHTHTWRYDTSGDSSGMAFNFRRCVGVLWAPLVSSVYFLLFNAMPCWGGSYEIPSSISLVWRL